MLEELFLMKIIHIRAHMNISSNFHKHKSSNFSRISSVCDDQLAATARIKCTENDWYQRRHNPSQEISRVIKKIHNLVNP